MYVFIVGQRMQATKVVNFYSVVDEEQLLVTTAIG